MQGSELEIFKEIPGYKAIMKAVLRNQIQMLVQQLYEHVGEEAVLLTASVSDGSSSYLGSESGKVFVQDHDEIKTQFLGYCLKRHHRKKTEDKSDFQRTSEIVFPSPHLESSSHCSSASLVQRKPHSRKRPAPYSEPSRQGSQRVFDNKRQSVPAKQIPLTAECERKEQYFQDKKMKTESQNSDNEDTGDFSSATERTGSSALLQGTDDNLQESINAVSTEDVNDSENSSEGEDISVEIKTEPSELLDDTVNSGAAGVESLPEKNDYSKWKTNIAASGEGSLDHDLIPANELNDIKRELYGDTIKPVHLFKVTTISGHSRSGGKGFQSRTKQSIVTKSHGDLNKRKKNTAEKNTDLNDISYQERPYPCPQCNKRFKVKHHLVYHLRVHSGERPYKCETCNSTFTQTSSLKTHIQAKHWKSCMCRNCGQLFKSRFFMSQHTCGSMGSEEERKDDLVVLE